MPESTTVHSKCTRIPRCLAQWGVFWFPLVIHTAVINCRFGLHLR